MVHQTIFSSGDLAKALRDQRMSQADLAYLAGVTPQTVSNWLSGRTPMPRWLRLFMVGATAEAGSIGRLPMPVQDAAPEAKKPAPQRVDRPPPAPQPGYTPTPEEAAAAAHRQALLAAGQPIPLADWKAANFPPLATFPDWVADKSDPANIMIVKRV